MSIRSAYFVFLTAFLLRAQTAVVLSSEAAPASVEPGVTVVSVTGSGFPVGAISPANVTVSLQPAKAGTGATAAIHAVSIQQIVAGTDKVTFQAPASLSLPQPTAYLAAISGTNLNGVAFASVNSASVTVNPAAQIISVTPGLGNAGVSLQVTITGTYSNFLQGVTQANFGPGVSVGGSPAGQPGPLTVLGPTSAVAQLAIASSAAAGSQAVMVATGAEQANATFEVGAQVAVVNVDLSSSTPIAAGLSGFDDEFLIHGVEYFDPKYIAAVQPLKPGWVRFPAGTPSMGFDWQAGHLNQAWINQLTPLVGTVAATALVRSQNLTQAKGGVLFSDYATFCKTVGAWSIVAFNTYSDTNPGSASNIVQAAQNAGLAVHEWELANEPWGYPAIYPTAQSYAAAMYSPYFRGFTSADPNAITGISFQGQFAGNHDTSATWDNGLSGYTPTYWNGVSVHVYPIVRPNISPADEQARINGVLAHGTNEYLDSYLLPLIGANTPLFVTEVNDGHYTNVAFESYLYNGIFLAEFTARMSTSPNVKAVGATALYLGNTFNLGMIRAVDDHEKYLVDQVQQNPSYSTNTATNPETQFQFYYSAPGLAMEVLNQAINSSTHIWPTTVSGGPTVGIVGYDNQPIPAIFAQGYMGDQGTHYLVLINKYRAAVPVGIQVNGNLLPGSLTVSYVSNSDFTVQNTASEPNSVQIVSATSSNPVTLGPYSVTRIEW